MQLSAGPDSQTVIEESEVHKEEEEEEEEEGKEGEIEETAESNATDLISEVEELLHEKPATTRSFEPSSDRGAEDIGTCDRESPHA